MIWPRKTRVAAPTSARGTVVIDAASATPLFTVRDVDIQATEAGDA
jgi:hypothetical protein